MADAFNVALGQERRNLTFWHSSGVPRNLTLGPRAGVDLIESGLPLYLHILTRNLSDPRFTPVGLRSSMTSTETTSKMNYPKQSKILTSSPSQDMQTALTRW